ncbi:flagellar motor switch phosphatase FliY [Bacillus carboniphilus]|uniref:Flagellar motor switch protein FliN n=1 Tax=Bacillus carboniphilus TaxID=86663 RepID=A0ABP3G1Z5_9BACI
MSNDMLSQDEIDALLRGASVDDPDEETTAEDKSASEYFNPMELDALGEIGNISFGSSATALSTLLNQKVEITTPSIGIIEKRRLPEEFPHPYVAIKVQYTDGFSGSNLLVIKQSDAAIIADLMLGGTGNPESKDMGEIQVSAVQEAMNQMMGSAATSMSTVFSKRIDISPPVVDLLDVPQGEGTERLPDEDHLLKISFRLTVGTLIDSNIMQLLPLHFAKSMVEDLLNPSTGVEEVAATQTVAEQVEVANKQPVEPSEPSLYSQPAESPRAETARSQQTERPKPAKPEMNVQPAMFSSFEEYKPTEPESKNLDMLLDIPLQITVELGRTKKSVKDILELASGSIIELDKLAGEPVDILINSRLIAKGEVVVIDENFGVRVTDILSPRDRINKLR